MYRAEHRDRAIHVYVLMYDQSIDEQRYVMSVAKERNAFERLIKERGVRDRTLPRMPRHGVCLHAPVRSLIAGPPKSRGRCARHRTSH